MEMLNNTSNWAFVLCGGGAKGAYQIGVWKALEEYGFMKNLLAISGDSIGAVNEALMAAMDVDSAWKLWQQIDFLTVFDTELKLIDMVEGVCSRDGLLEIMRQHIDYDKLSNSNMDLFVNLTRLGETGYDMMLPEYTKLNHQDKERIEKIILASSALPLIYEAVEIDGKYYRDGGLLDNMPIKPLYDHGYRKILIVALDDSATINTDLYPDCEILMIKPSKDLGDLLFGTLNFDKQKLDFCMKLGYKDAVRQLKAYLYQDPDFISQLPFLAELDYQEIMQEQRMNSLQSDVDEHMSKLQSIIDQYK